MEQRTLASFRALRRRVQERWQYGMTFAEGACAAPAQREVATILARDELEYAWHPY